MDNQTLSNNQIALIIKQEAISHFLCPSIDSKSREHEILWPRYLAVYYTTIYTKITLSNIGRMYKRDHSSIVHSKKKHKELNDPKFGDSYYRDMNKRFIKHLQNTNPNLFG